MVKNDLTDMQHFAATQKPIPISSSSSLDSLVMRPVDNTAPNNVKTDNISQNACEIPSQSIKDNDPAFNKQQSDSDLSPVNLSMQAIPLPSNEASTNVQSNAIPYTSLNPSERPATDQHSPVPSIYQHSPVPSVMSSLDPMTIYQLQTSGNMLSNAADTNSIPEFLYQLTKMLTDDNRGIIEWSNGKIEVHSPQKLETDVLKNYFRHSKFASFQRQLNYFGFRKLAGKGKMAPCSYVNEAAGADIDSLLHIKRKGSVLQTQKEAGSKKSKLDSTIKSPKIRAASGTEIPVNPVLAGIFNRTKDAIKHLSVAPASSQQPTISSSNAGITTNIVGVNGYQALAQTAVGRGIRHSFTMPVAPTMVQSTSIVPNSSQIPAALHQPTPACQSQHQHMDQYSLEAMPCPHENVTTNSSSQGGSNDSLSQLANNFRNSLFQVNSELLADADPTPLSELQNTSTAQGDDTLDFYTGLFSRNTSLVDLAMMDCIEESKSIHNSREADDIRGFGFIDFPSPELNPGGATSDGAWSEIQ